MLESARSHAPDSGAAPIEYRLCPADALAVDDGEAHGVTCQHGLQFFPDRVAALSEMRRITRADGRLAVALWAPIEQSPIFAALAYGVGAVLGAEVAAAYRRGPWALTDPDELRSLAVQAGWREVTVEPRELPIEFAGPAQLVASLGITPLAARLTALDAAGRRDLIDAVCHGLGAALDDDGAVRSSTAAQFLLATNRQL
jgi:SAM-dependent methyltransferase